MKPETKELIIEKADQSYLEWIVQCQVDMALETENLKLNYDTVVQGVSYIFNNPDRGFYLLSKISPEQPIGILLILKEWSDWRNGDIWWIHSVFVKEQFRRKKIFSKMFNFLEKLASSNQVRGLRLYVDKSNHKAFSVYKQLGMTNKHYELFEKLF
jgi:GNAT superfamily N-acetyltransferase